LVVNQIASDFAENLLNVLSSWHATDRPFSGECMMVFGFTGTKASV